MTVTIQKTATAATFGGWLRALRAVRRETQDEVSASLAISSTLLSAWEIERVVPVKVEQVLRLSAWSGVPRSEIFELVARDIDARALAI